jgi:hypothetical protein
MTTQFETAVKNTLSLGPYLFTCFFYKQDDLMTALGLIPYIKLDGAYLVARKGTACQAISNVTNKGKDGFALVTGGDLTPAEANETIQVLNKYAHEQKYAMP